MNYYEHHIGDYAAATSHLSFVEDAAYSRLLRIYYRDEKALPLELKAVQRLVGARTREEKEAVDTVLNEFFRAADDGWHSKRCDEEIERYREKQDEKLEERENEAERKRRYRQRRSELFELLRDHGIVPAFDTPMRDLERQLSRVTGTGQDDGRPTGQYRTGTAIHTPDTRHQTPDVKATAGTTHITEQAPGGGTPAGHLAAALNRAGLRTTSHDPRLIEAADLGITADEVLELRAIYPDKPAAYLLKAAVNQRAERAKETDHAARKPARRLSAVDRVAENIREARERDQQRDDDAIPGEAVRVVG